MDADLNFGRSGGKTFMIGMCIVPAALLFVLGLMRFTQ
jgi:hypothetical protein